jgi:DNA-binding SARP family transcriptional activator
MEILRYDPAYERTHSQLMRLYILSGMDATLHQYERCAKAWDEFGIEPSSHTTALGANSSDLSSSAALERSVIKTKARTCWG